MRTTTFIRLARRPALLALPVLLAGLSAGPSRGDLTPDALMQQGAHAYETGAFEDAIGHWKAAARAYHDGGAPAGESRALASAAQAQQALGHSTDALQTLELASALAQRAPDPLWKATLQSQLGRTYLAARQLDAAEQHLTQARELAVAALSPSLTASVMNDLGVLHALKRQDTQALDDFKESAALAQDAHLPVVGVNARINAARVALRQGQAKESRDWLDEALNQLKDLPESRDKAAGMVNIGLGYQHLLPAFPDLHDPLLLRSAGALQEGITAAERINDRRTLSYALGYLGHLYELEHRADEAMQLSRRAIFTSQAADAPESLYRWQWQLGRLLASGGSLDEGIAAYRQAVTTLQPIRFEVTQAAAEASLSGQESVRPLFFELADLLLQRAARTDDEAAAQGYLLAARDAVEAYKATELRDYFKDSCVDAVRARITSFDRLASNTAVIYPILFPSRLELLVSGSGGLTRVMVPVGADRMTKEIRAFRRLVEKRTTREYLPHAQQLYDWLIRPLEGHLSRMNVTTLVLVPDASLRTIPMAALHDGGRFLVQKYAVALTPGLTLTDPRPLNRQTLRFLATGLTQGVQGFPPLPYVAEEVESVRELYRADQLLNQDFLARNLEQELRTSRYSILHIATHGKFSTDVDDSFLLTFDGKLTLGQLDQLIGMFKYRDDPLELLTLSACQTGVGDDRAALGLAGVAIKAGARSALATLWFINDEASAALLAEFYRELRNPSVSKAQAMQRAQLKLLDDRVYEHPAYWSPFLLLNNWL
jgi:CHAT domain-containing protein